MGADKQTAVLAIASGHISLDIGAAAAVGGVARVGVDTKQIELLLHSSCRPVSGTAQRKGPPHSPRHGAVRGPSPTKPGNSGKASRPLLTAWFDYFTPIVMEAELLAGLLSVPLNVTWPVVDMVPVPLNVTFTVTTIA